MTSSLKRGKSYVTARDAIMEAAIALADCDSDSEVAWHRAWMRLRWVLVSHGWRPPRKGQTRRRVQ